MMSVLFIIIYLICSCAGLVLMKYGATNNGLSVIGKAINLKMSYFSITGMFFYVLSFLLWMVILQKFKLSYISPLISGISYVLIILASFFVLHEKITQFQWAGMGVIFVGVILMNVK